MTLAISSGAVDLNADEVVILGRIRALLDQLPDLAARAEKAMRSAPAMGSRAQRDLALPDGRFVGIFAGHALVGALADLSTWRVIANGPEIPLRSHLILMRSSLEGSVLCRWLLDPTVRPVRRVARGLAARRDDQAERRDFEASFPDRGKAIANLLGPKGKTGLERLDELDHPDQVTARTAAGIPASGFADTTSLMRKHGIEPTFRLLSGLAHSKEWSIIVTEAHPEDHEPSPGVRQGRFSASLPWAEIFTDLALAAARSAVGDLERYRLQPVGSAARSDEPSGGNGGKGSA